MTTQPDGALGPVVAPPRRGATTAEVLSVLCTAAALAWLPFLARPGRWPITVLVALAVLAGSAGVIADLSTLPARRRSARVGDAPTTEEPTTEGTFTTIVVLGDEPAELQRHSVVLARRAGPCIVVSPGGDHGLSDLDVEVVTPGPSGSWADALRDAVDRVDTDGVLLLSGRATPVADSCRRAAALLDDHHAAVVGSTRSFNDDGYGSDTRGRVSSRLRRRGALVGLALWEPNATLVRTEDLRRDPLPDRRPRGAWLRARRSEGRGSIDVAEPLAMVASPAGAHTFWPQSMAHQRGAAADAADAVRSTRGVARLAALAFATRACFAWSMVAWLVVLFTGTISGELPFRTAHGSFAALVGVTLLLRWIGLYRSVGQSVHPLQDLRATVDRVPGSLAALPSAVTGRVVRTSARVSVRPLLWAGLLSAAVLATGLVDHTPGTRMTTPAVAVALLTLVLLWLVCIQLLVQRGWERTTFRVPVALSAHLDGRRGRTVDASPDGVAVELLHDDGMSRRGSGSTGDDAGDDAGDDDAPAGLPAAGQRVVVTIDLDDGTETTCDATVAWSHHGHRRDLVGLMLDLDPSTRSAWAAQVLRAAEAHPERGAIATTTPQRAAPRALDAAGLVLTVVMSVVLLAVLGGAMLGLQAAVVRSGSMTPTIAQGSVVVSESVPVTSLRPGDVITRPAEGPSEPVTHRLVSTTRQGNELLVQTRGDANQSGETWTVPADASIQRIRWVVPSIGQAIALLRSNLVLVLGLALIAGLLVAALRVPGRPVRRAPRPGTVA